MANKLKGNTLVTESKTVTTGSGEVLLKGDIMVSIDQTQDSGTGDVKIKGNTGVTGIKTFGTGVGSVTLAGHFYREHIHHRPWKCETNIPWPSGPSGWRSSVKLAGLTMIIGTKTFDTSSGAVQLQGNTLVIGTKAFGTGSEAVSLACFGQSIR